MTDYQLIDVQTRPEAVLVRIKEEYLSTAIIADMLYDELQQVITTWRPAVLVLNFEQVKMMSSSTIGRLLMVHKQLQEYGGQLRLCCLSVPIAEVYRTLGLTGRHLMVFDTVEQALHTRIVGLDDEREVMED